MKTIFSIKTSWSSESQLHRQADNLNISFEKNLFTLGVFIDICKAFETTDNEILTSKLERYGDRGLKFNYCVIFIPYFTHTKI